MNHENQTNHSSDNCYIMTKEAAIKLFEEKQVRTVWDAEQEKWYIYIVDVIALLTESIDPNAYWRKLKQRLKEVENETVTIRHGLKMLAADGKMRLTDVAWNWKPKRVKKWCHS